MAKFNQEMIVCYTRENGKTISAKIIGELVRCRDCKKAEHEKIFREYWCKGRKVNPNGYCSDGEKKDGDNHD